MISGIILDVDGALVDSNNAHTTAWIEAMAENGHKVAFDEVRSLIGMGGDKVLPGTIGKQKDSEEGSVLASDAKKASWSVFFLTYAPFQEPKNFLSKCENGV